MTFNWKRTLGICGSVALITASAAYAQADTLYAQADGAQKRQQKLEKAKNQQLGTDKANQESQQRIDATYDKKQSLLHEYRSALQQIEAMTAYNNHLRTMILSQKDEMTNIDTQVKKLEQTSKEVIPLMLDMVTALEQFVALDMPFLTEERQVRLTSLQTMLKRADVSDAEKFRRILEAYQIENEYGRTLEAYRGKVNLGGKETVVDFLRVGRVSLVYQTLDGEQSGYWDSQAKAWKSLDSAYQKPIRSGLRIARKQAPPSLIQVPVSAPVATKVEGL